MNIVHMFAVYAFVSATNNTVVMFINTLKRFTLCWTFLIFLKGFYTPRFKTNVCDCALSTAM